MNNRISGGLWLKTLISILVICSLLIVPGYLYYQNSSCGSNFLECFEFKFIILGGGILALGLPIIIIMFFWELSKKIREKKEEREMMKKY